EKINELGKKYSIITRNTSLIVLDQVADYVRYEIEPPAALKEQYDQLIAQQKQTRSNTTKQSIDFAKAYVNELDKWSKEEFKVGPIVKKEMKTEVQNIQRRRPGRRASRSLVPPPPPPAPVYDERVVTAYTGVAMDSARMPSTVRPSMRQQGFATFDPFSADIVLRDRNPVLGEAAGKSGGFDYDGRVVGQDRIVNDGSGKIKMKEVNVVADYLKTINAASKTDRYSAYTKLRTGNELPSFYFNVANAFFKDGDSINGYKILSNIAELDLDDHESYKMLGYRLKNVGRFDDEISMFKKVLDLRPQDPQSYRDYALALEDAGRYQEALNFLYMALTKDFDGQIRSLYRGIEDIIVTEINELIAKHGDKLDISMIPKELIYNIPVDVRVVINWNMNATDIDLWVFDPNDEKVYYGHKLSEIGGRISTDFTQGYGPEQFLLKKAMKGKYKVAINYFGDRQQKLAGPTTVMAEIFTNYGRPAQERQMITLQMKKGSSGEVMVGEFEF
ncbi:MAG TPA: DUF2135 domain-containing protein, partial [Ferruginibacter sp.]|nr:DUF2135 domain-containing protein [Ferruginibacter sp.]